MTATSYLKRRCLALSLVAALAAAGASARQPDPEPESPADRKGEKATPAVDLARSATDAKLAQQERANHTKSSNHLKLIGIAFHNHNDTYGYLSNDIRDRRGKALLSWRVALLPYLDQARLHKQFKLDEPWDSKHNLKLLEKMPDVFRSPRVKTRSKGNTVYQVFKGPNAPFGRAAAPRIPASFPDGTSNTILVVEATDAVPWTKPADIAFDRTKKLPDFGKAFGKRPLAVLADGSVRVLNLNTLREETLKNAIDPADGIPLGADW